MSFTGLDSFDRAVHTANAWIKELQRSLGWDDRSHTYAAFRAVIWTLRDRLPPEEAAQLAAQLPMLLAGVFVQGWRPAATPVRMDEEGVMERVETELGRSAPGADARWAAECVLGLLSNRVSTGELSDVVSVLPEDLREMWSSRNPGVPPEPRGETRPSARNV